MYASPTAGFGGGNKIIMPVCSYRAVADHHFAWIRHRYAKVNVMEGNPFMKRSPTPDGWPASPSSSTSSLTIRRIIRAFAGETTAEHKEARSLQRRLLGASRQGCRRDDHFRLPNGDRSASTKALTMAGYATRSGGIIIWVAPQKEAGPIMPLSRKWQVPRRQPTSTGD